MREVEGEEVVGADELEDAVDAFRVEFLKGGGEVGFEQDVVSAGGSQFGDFSILPRRGDDGAGVVFGEEDRPYANATGAAVYEDR